MIMKHYTLVFLLLFSAALSQAQSDTSLNGRLAAFFHANDVFDIEKVMDYTYPKLFTLVPREEMIESMKEGYDNDEVKIDIDSMKADRVYSPIQIGGGIYTRIDYSMIMLVKLKGRDNADTTGNAEMISEMESAFKDELGNTAVFFDPATQSIRIVISSAMAAIKDSYSKDWSFVNLKQDDLTKQLLGEDVVVRLSALRTQ